MTYDHNVKGDDVEDPVDCVCRGKVVQVLNSMKTGNTTGSSDVSLESISASWDVGIQVMADIFQSHGWIWNDS